ncbi:unnamed protein product, partial [Rotaria sp. Silwood1]
VKMTTQDSSLSSSIILSQIITIVTNTLSKTKDLSSSTVMNSLMTTTT